MNSSSSSSGALRPSPSEWFSMVGLDIDLLPAGGRPPLFPDGSPEESTGESPGESPGGREPAAPVLETSGRYLSLIFGHSGTGPAAAAGVLADTSTTEG